MLSKQHLKFIKSLQLKKYRKQAQSFIVEGEKSVVELIHSSIKIKTIIATKRFLDYHFHLLHSKGIECIETSEKTLNNIGTFQQNQTVLAVAQIPVLPPLNIFEYSYIPVFEYLQDPGNLGTILRICDWYGINVIVLSSDSVDVYNSKVIQSSMGSFTRIHVYYEDLENIQIPPDYTMIGTTLDGQDVHQFIWPDKAMIIFGNESQGISNKLYQKLDRKITIPKFGAAESLNVSVATGIVLDQLKSKT